MSITDYSLYPSSVPSGAFAADATSYTLGTGIHLLTEGTITAIRFYYAHESNIAWPVVGHLFTGTGEIKGSGESQGSRPVADGWVLIPLAVPFVVSGPQTMVASIFKGGGAGYWHAASYWPEHEVVVPGVMEAPIQPGIVGGAENGLFNSTSTPDSFPNADFQNGNFFVDVVFAVGEEEPKGFKDARLGWKKTPGGFMINKGAL